MASPDQSMELHLPVTVWEDIFKQLPFHQLKTARQTCAHWKAIIDKSPSLMKKIHLTFPKNFTIDRKFKPPSVISARSVTFTNCRISSVDSWWNALGKKLTELTVKDCQISFPTLQKMLQATPNLERLDYLCGSYPAVCLGAGVSLEKLRHLSVDNPCMDVLDVFGASCPNLTHFALLQQNDKKRVLRFLKGKKDTLREVELTSLAYSLNVLLQIKGLSSLNIAHEVTSTEILCIIGKGLPQLKSIAVKLMKPTALEPSFLATMPELESLTIKSTTYNGIGKLQINFSEFSNPKLKHLGLFHVEPVCESLHKYLKSTPELQSVMFEYCHFENWKEIFTAVDQSESLKRIEMFHTRVTKEEPYLFELKYQKLEYLKLINCPIPRPSLKYILWQSKQVKTIHLKQTKIRINDDILRFVAKSAKLIRI